MGSIPVPVPKGKPVDTRTRASWVRVQTGTGKGSLIFTHGLPVSNTSYQGPADAKRSPPPEFTIGKQAFVKAKFFQTTRPSVPQISRQVPWTI
jgi:hypothetical protein